MKSRFVKKLIAASLVTAMSVSMVACGENTDDAPQSSTCLLYTSPSPRDTR